MFTLFTRIILYVAIYYTSVSLYRFRLYCLYQTQKYGQNVLKLPCYRVYMAGLQSWKNSVWVKLHIGKYQRHQHQIRFLPLNFFPLSIHIHITGTVTTTVIVSVMTTEPA